MSATEVENLAGAAPRNNDRSLGELFSELAAETGTLVRQEVKLAATEITHKATYAGQQAVYIAVGFLLGLVSVLALIFALIFGLATFIALWKSALLVGLVAAAAAFLVAMKGISALRAMNLVPQQTIQSLKEDKQWVQQHVR